MTVSCVYVRTYVCVSCTPIIQIEYYTLQRRRKYKLYYTDMHCILLDL